MDDRSAEATLTDGRLSVTTRVRFGADGLIASMSADECIRAVTEGVMTTAPWGCRLSDYRRVDGMKVPFASEVLWHLPEGDKPHFRGTITRLAYEMAP